MLSHRRHVDSSNRGVANNITSDNKYFCEWMNELPRYAMQQNRKPYIVI